MEPNINCLSCLICSNSKAESSKCSTNPEISKRLHVNFLLRKVLEVPSSKLVIFLKASPEESWLSVCDKCTQIVNQCKVTYQMILEAERKLRSAKQKVVQLIKETISQEELDTFHDKPTNIMRAIRGFAYHNRYPKKTDNDPFISGHQQAYQQLSENALEQLEEEDDNQLWGNELRKSIKINDSISLSSCLICGGGGDKSKKVPSSENFGISEHLHVIFLLRIVLEVDSAKLVIFLKSEPSLESWISVCDKCNDMVNNCKGTYQDVLRAQIEFRRVRQGILQSLNERPLVKREKEEGDVIGTNIVEEIREFVCQNRYPEIIDPFIYGDQLCKEKLRAGVEGDADKQFSPTSGTKEDTISLPMTIDQDFELLNRKPSKRKKETKSKAKTSRRRRVLKGRLQKTPFSEENDANENLPCKACKKTFPTSGEEFEKHMECLHVSRTKFICPRCGSKTDGLDEHLKHRTNCKDNHGHDHDGKKDEDNLVPIPKVKKVLKKRKEENSSKSCEFCGKEFKTATVCRRHGEFVHEKKWRCSRCGVVKWTKRELDRHEPLCSLEEKIWACPVEECGLVYETVGALRIHMGKLHKGVEKIKVEEEGEKAPLICESCGATYAKRNQLSVHRSTSAKCRLIRGLEERKRDPVICQLCGKSYPNKRQLHLHNRTVHEKRFSKWCELCGMGFVGKRGLERHLWGKHKVGEGDKAWRCEVKGCTAQICGEKSREAHMRSRHKGWRGGEREDNIFN